MTFLTTRSKKLFLTNVLTNFLFRCMSYKHIFRKLEDVTFQMKLLTCS